MKTVILIYEIGQISALRDLLPSFSNEERNELTIVALGADIEFALEKEGLLFQSGRGLRKTGHVEALGFAERVGREVLQDDSLSFFTYRNMPLQEIFIPMLQLYVTSVIYFIDIFSSLVEHYPMQKLILLPSTRVVLETSGTLAVLEERAALDVAELIGKTHGIEIDIRQTRSIASHTRKQELVFNFKRRMLGVALWVLNGGISIFAPRKRIHVIASESWKNIQALMEQLPDVQLTLLDRAELRKIGLRSAWKHRMRFVHIDQYPSYKGKQASERFGAESLKKWKKTKDANTVINTSFRGVSLALFLEPAIERILSRGGQQAAALIEGCFSMYERLCPQLVLVRASASAQLHFALMCEVAKAMNVPSLEVQHGILFLGETSFSKKHFAQYIATYGPQVSRELAAAGHPKEELCDIGSPRFDVYTQMRARPKQDTDPFTICVIVPAVLPNAWSDSYEVAEYLEYVAAAAAALPNAHVILKLRPDPFDEAFYKKAIAQTFKRVSHRIAQYEPLVDMIEASDAVIVIYSTTVYEGLISGRPVIYNATLAMHRELGKEIQAIIDAGVLIAASDPQELAAGVSKLANDPHRRQELVQKADEFMEKNFSFDGRSSEKLAHVIRTLAHRHTKANHKPHEI